MQIYWRLFLLCLLICVTDISLRASLIFTALNFRLLRMIFVAWWPGTCLVPSTPKIRSFSRWRCLHRVIFRSFSAFLWSPYINLLLNSTSRSRVAKCNAIYSCLVFEMIHVNQLLPSELWRIQVWRSELISLMQNPWIFRPIQQWKSTHAF